MFARRVTVELVVADAEAKPCPVKWIDSFAMRNFTNDAVFDDTLPLGDGAMEIGNRVPVPRLEAAMEDWFRRKGYVKAGERVRVVETERRSGREAGSSLRSE
jgi:hypothetical protein